MWLINRKPTKSLALASALALGTTLFGALLPLQADETCQSPYMAKIVGQEDFVYVWTLGIEGLGDGQDKLVTIDVNPKSSANRKSRLYVCSFCSAFSVI
ncbi:MAG: hypothetical protein AB2610_08340 [Candidatus Thiodiazotropha sp.]